IYHVARGGGSNSDVKNLRTFIRQAVIEDSASQYLGFRCAYNGKVNVIEKKSKTTDDSTKTNEKTLANNILSTEEPGKEAQKYRLYSEEWEFAKFESNAEYGGKISENLKLKLVEMRKDGIEVYQRNTDGMRIVRVPGGYFKVGDVFNIGSANERPGKYIWVPEFFMDLTEISNEQYCKFLNTGKLDYSLAAKFYDFENSNSELTFDGKTYKTTDFSENLPVRFITFSGASAYSLWAWNQGWQNYENISCLPTEAMFEKASAYDYANKRKRMFSFGNEILNREQLSINKKNTMDSDKSSGDESSLGIMHMSDNVSEWCVDAFLKETCGKLRQLGIDLPQREYMLDFSPNGRVVKGANYSNKNMKKLRCSFRFNMQENVKSANIGFRCAFNTGYMLSPLKKTANQEVKIVSTNNKIELKEIAKNFKKFKRFRRLNDNMSMVLIESGEYNINVTDDKKFTKVKLSKYLIDETEVTVSMFCKFLDDYRSSIVKDGIYKGETILLENSHSQINIVKQENGETEYSAKKGWNLRPIYDITWFGAYEYAKWVGAELPTEAQWESAARGNTLSSYPWGDDVPTYRHASFKIGKRIVIPGKIGSYRLGNSYFGIKDMAGNVWEWCLDNYHFDRINYGDAVVSINPCDFRVSKKKVIKGGCYNSNAKTIKISSRRGINPELVYSLIGFRCVYNFPNELPEDVDESNIR
ncbi:MAG: SUMF1/EgtB/PvdO family nonheme iron enzyme, partial [Planctomycetes bacterium]|nr:SUMF1/EgtB/PvdO family nonheme iron enzyme [Planctomycetota bacterium]